MPDGSLLTGLAAFGRTVVGIMAPRPSLDSGGRLRLDSNPAPFLILSDGQIANHPLRANGTLYYGTGVLPLQPSTFLVEAAETLFRFHDGTVVEARPFANRSPVGTRSAGLFRVGDEVFVLQRLGGAYDAGNYAFLQLQVCDPDTLDVRPVGLPLLTNSRRKFGGTKVDHYGSHFLFRAEGRYHYLTWQGGDAVEREGEPKGGQP